MYNFDVVSSLDPEASTVFIFERVPTFELSPRFRGGKGQEDSIIRCFSSALLLLEQCFHFYYRHSVTVKTSLNRRVPRPMCCPRILASFFKTSILV